MGRGIDESAIVMLAVDFNQRGAERAQHLHADRLIVDEGAGAAVGELHPAHDQFVVAAKIVVGEHAARRMLLGDFERGGHLTLFGAFTHQGRVAARAERQRKRVEQDRFAGAGLAGQRGKAGAEIDVQAIDQNDVADGKASEHGDDEESDVGSGSWIVARILPILGLSVVSRQPLCVSSPAHLLEGAADPGVLVLVVGSPPADFTRL